MNNLKIIDFLKAGVHLGHNVGILNPKALPYIYGIQNKMYFLDVVKSARYLKLAAKYLENAASKKKKIIFIGRSTRIRSLISQEAKRSKSYYINYRWLGGTLTNWSVIKEKMKLLNNLKRQKLNGEFNLLSKQEYSKRENLLLQLEKTFEGIQTMFDLPDIAIIIDLNYEMAPILECRKLKIPIISIIDSNCDPDLVDFVIPGNDQTEKSVGFILNILTNSIIKGKERIVQNI